MNKYHIDGVIIVEGKTDVSYLSSFISSLFFITNGYDISEEKIDFLDRVSKVNRLIVLTDNDIAGEQIESRIKSKISGVIALKTRKITRNNYKKSGVAETTKEEILEVLKPYISVDKNASKMVDHNLSKILSLAKDKELVKKEIIKEYRLIDGNNKYLNLQLNMLKVDPIKFSDKYGNK